MFISLFIISFLSILIVSSLSKWKLISFLFLSSKPLFMASTRLSFVLPFLILSKLFLISSIPPTSKIHFFAVFSPTFATPSIPFYVYSHHKVRWILWCFISGSNSRPWSCKQRFPLGSYCIWLAEWKVVSFFPYWLPSTIRVIQTHRRYNDYDNIG